MFLSANVVDRVAVKLPPFWRTMVQASWKSVHYHWNKIRFITLDMYVLSGKVIFRKVDLVKAYHQDGIGKTAIITPIGLFEFSCIPFCCTNIPTVHQWSLQRLRFLLSYRIAYIDDIRVGTWLPGLKPLPQCVYAIVNYKQPNTVKDTRRFLGSTTTSYSSWTTYWL